MRSAVREGPSSSLRLSRSPTFNHGQPVVAHDIVAQIPHGPVEQPRSWRPRRKPALKFHGLPTCHARHVHLVPARNSQLQFGDGVLKGVAQHLIA